MQARLAFLLVTLFTSVAGANPPVYVVAPYSNDIVWTVSVDAVTETARPSSQKNDLQVLPNGDLLIAGGGGIGVGVYRPSEGRFVWQLPGTSGEIKSAVVLEYDDAGAPLRVLVGHKAQRADTGDVESFGGRAYVWHVREARITWSMEFFHMGDRSVLEHAIVLPDGRYVVANNFSGRDFFTVDVVNPETNRIELRIANHDRPDPSVDRIVVLPIQWIHDLEAQPDGDLLLAGGGRLWRLHADGSEVWRRWCGVPGASGDTKTLRRVTRERVAHGVFDPGVLDGADPDHRVAWAEYATSDFLELSPVIPRAIYRLAAIGGSGGTGTAGWYANHAGGGTGLLEVTLPETAPGAAAPGGTVHAMAQVTNPTGGLVALRDLVLTARRPGATHAGGPYDDIARTGVRLFDPGESIPLEGDFAVPADGPTGTWRVYVAAQDLGGDWHDVTEEGTFEVLGAAIDAGAGVDAGPVAGRDAGPRPDARVVGGVDAGLADGGFAPDAEDGGCACRAGAGRGATPWWGLSMLAALIGWRRARNQRGRLSQR